MTEMISEDLLSVPEIKKAIELTKESYYSKAQLEAYDKYWDSIRTEKMFLSDAEAKGIQIGEERGIQIGEERERERERKNRIETARKLLRFGVLTDTQISEATGLSLQEILELKS